MTIKQLLFTSCVLSASLTQSDKEQVYGIDYKNATFLKGFLTERGKILPSRISGACARHQRVISQEIRKSRVMALLPYSGPAF